MFKINDLVEITKDKIFSTPYCEIAKGTKGVVNDIMNTKDGIVILVEVDIDYPDQDSVFPFKEDEIKLIEK